VLKYKVLIKWCVLKYVFVCFVFGETASVWRFFVDWCCGPVECIAELVPSIAASLCHSHNQSYNSMMIMIIVELWGSGYRSRYSYWLLATGWTVRGLNRGGSKRFSFQNLPDRLWGRLDGFTIDNIQTGNSAQTRLSVFCILTLVSLRLQANAEMVPKFSSCYYMPLM
jgi:hypothetical protein